MAAKSKGNTYRRTKRIYYGPPGAETSRWWTVEVSPAKHDVEINGEMLHALRSDKGVSIGCTLSNVGFENGNQFPHAVYLVVVTKSMILVVDKLNKDGSPKHAQQYAHSYGHITEKNDIGTIKKMVLDNPSIIERSFRLRVPRSPRKPEGKTAHADKTAIGTSRRTKAIMHRGSLQRAVVAGLIPPNVAKQLSVTRKKEK